MQLFDGLSSAKVNKPIQVVSGDPAHSLGVHLLVAFVEELLLNHQVECLDAGSKISRAQLTAILIEVVVNRFVEAVGRFHNISDCFLVEVTSKVWRLLVRLLISSSGI